MRVRCECVREKRRWGRGDQAVGAAGAAGLPSPVADGTGGGRGVAEVEGEAGAPAGAEGPVEVDSLLCLNACTCCRNGSKLTAQREQSQSGRRLER